MANSMRKFANLYSVLIVGILGFAFIGSGFAKEQIVVASAIVLLFYAVIVAIILWTRPITGLRGNPWQWFRAPLRNAVMRAIFLMLFAGLVSYVSTVSTGSEDSYERILRSSKAGLLQYQSNEAVAVGVIVVVLVIAWIAFRE